MMRVLVGLMWGIALLCIWNAPTRGQAPGPPVHALRDWPTQVEGLGLDDARAKDNAVKEAQKLIVAFIRKQNLPLTAWVPSEAYIKSQLIDKEQRGKDLDPLGTGSDTARRWTIYLKVPEWETLVRLNREALDVQRALLGQERMRGLAKIFAGVLVLLSAVAGCIRLDDRTHGSYTRWWQLAGAALVAAAFAGIWILS